jgi:formate-dependent nitrite reductase cytochrome c552 subunit
MVDKFEEAKAAGVEDAALAPMRDKHYEAQIHWEWWTASNGAAFHNPDAATESINKSMALSQEAIKLLEDAIGAKRGAAKVSLAAPAAAERK